MLDDIYKETRKEMEKVVEHFKEELSKVRTGRANPKVLDNIKVLYYGTPTPLRQIAGIQIPEPRTIVIQPWDKNSIGAIEKAIQEANIGVNPNSDGVVIRLPFPQLSEDTRKDSLKHAKNICEKFKVSLRNVRHEQIDLIKQLEKDKDLTEDNRKTGIEKIDKIIEEYIKQLDEILKEKEKQIMEI